MHWYANGPRILADVPLPIDPIAVDPAGNLIGIPEESITVQPECASRDIRAIRQPMSS